MTLARILAELQMERLDRLDAVALKLGRENTGGIDILTATLENMESDAAMMRLLLEKEIK